jgi:hypothetical protein
LEHDLFRKPVSTFRDHALTAADRDTLPPNQGYESQYLDLGAELAGKRQLSFSIDVLYFYHTIGWADGNSADVARRARRHAVDEARPIARRGTNMSDDTFHRSLIPLRWLAPLNPLKYDLVIIWNWLDAEIDARVERELPILQAIVGHRNRDVHNYIKATNDQWTLRYLGMEPWQIVQLELVRAEILARDEAQAPYEIGPPISPLHS